MAGCRLLPDTTESAAFMPDSGQAGVRLGLALLIGSIGSVGLWSVVVVLPVVQAEFGATRGAGVAGLHASRWSVSASAASPPAGSPDRFRHLAAIGLSIVFLGCGYVAAGLSTHAMAIHRGVFPDRARVVGDLRATDDGSLALVRAAIAGWR